jgi:hypothetical protein
VLLPRHFSTDEHDALVTLALSKMRRTLGARVTYVRNHFDGVIDGYRECSASEWLNTSNLLRRKVLTLFPSTTRWHPVHVLDLASWGGIQAHVDNDSGGQFVVGVCLASSAVMRLRSRSNPENRFDVLLEPGSLYVQR